MLVFQIGVKTDVESISSRNFSTKTRSAAFSVQEKALIAEITQLFNFRFFFTIYKVNSKKSRSFVVSEVLLLLKNLEKIST
jgi:hypothetical protein